MFCDARKVFLDIATKLFPGLLFFGSKKKNIVAKKHFFRKEKKMSLYQENLSWHQKSFM